MAVFKPRSGSHQRADLLTLDLGLPRFQNYEKCTSVVKVSRPVVVCYSSLTKTAFSRFQQGFHLDPNLSIPSLYIVFSSNSLIDVPYFYFELLPDLLSLFRELIRLSAALPKSSCLYCGTSLDSLVIRYCPIH